MVFRFQGLDRIVDTMRLIGRKRFSRLASVVSTLLVLVVVVILLRDDKMSSSRKTAQRAVLATDGQTTHHAVISSLRLGQGVGARVNASTTHRSRDTHNDPIQRPKADEKQSSSPTKRSNHVTSNENVRLTSKTRQIMKALESALPSNPPSYLSRPLPSTGVGTTAAARPPRPPVAAANPSTPPYPVKPPKERFIIYVCDKTRYCYGLGDRQRAVASLYVLSLLTNRTFGVIWTQPCPLTQFLRPNEVDWDIPAWKLRGKTSIQLEFLNPRKYLDVKTPFNELYPQDVVYIRTNHNIIFGLKHSPLYKPHLPKWARKRVTYVDGHGWKMLMKPTDLIRRPLNEMLVKIFQDQQLDSNIVNSLRSLKVCRDACDSLSQYEEDRNSKVTTKDVKGGVFNDTKVSEDKDVLGCVSELRKRMSSSLPRRYYNAGQASQDLISWRNLNMFCKSERFDRGKNNILNKNFDVESIRRAEGYDVVDLNLVCIHARIGRSPDMLFDKARNSMESTEVLWDFARPYMEKGQHLYIATDYDKVRRDSKAHFGLRAHSSSTPIVHIASVQKNQNETEGMALALWEQLLLMTSCKTLVQSHSGFSILAGAVREDLIGHDERYWFEGGKIRQIW